MRGARRTCAEVSTRDSVRAAKRLPPRMRYWQARQVCARGSTVRRGPSAEKARQVVKFPAYNILSTRGSSSSVNCRSTCARRAFHFPPEGTQAYSAAAERPGCHTKVVYAHSPTPFAARFYSIFFISCFAAMLATILLLTHY